MPTEQLPFFSDGLRLDADLHLPDTTPERGCPVVVVASGYQGLKVIHPERFARALTPLGYAVLAFDYRGFGSSEGERGRLVPQEWVLDVRAAVTRVAGHASIDADRIALLGWGLGGGVVVSEASDDERVRAVVCCNGIADGYRSTQHMHEDQDWQSLLARIRTDRAGRVATGRSEITSPWDIVRLAGDTRTDSYVDQQLYRAPGFGSGVTLESADRLLRFHPARDAADLRQPLLVVHGNENGLHPVGEAHALYDAAAGPKRLEILDGKGHTEWMFDGDPTFRHVVETVDVFLQEEMPARQPLAAGVGGTTRS